MQKVFIIEDDPHICSLFQIYFDSLGDYEVIIADEPGACPLYFDNACECSQESPCGNYLIVDQRLPQTTGLELIRRQVEKGCKGPVGNKAVISAHFTPAELSMAAELGCKVFRKPFLFKDISAWLDGTEEAAHFSAPPLA